MGSRLVAARCRRPRPTLYRRCEYEDVAFDVVNRGHAGVREWATGFLRHPTWNYQRAAAAGGIDPMRCKHVRGQMIRAGEVEPLPKNKPKPRPKVEKPKPKPRARPVRSQSETEALQRLAAQTVAKGEWVSDISQSLDIASRTLSRWRQRPDFREMVDRERAKLAPAAPPKPPKPPRSTAADRKQERIERNLAIVHALGTPTRQESRQAANIPEANTTRYLKELMREGLIEKDARGDGTTVFRPTAERTCPT
jgi:transposase-like protein